MPVKQNKKFKKAYILTVDMGYGHQRAVHPFKDIAACPVGWKGEDIITANNYPGIPKSDRRMWEGSRKLYETISKMKNWPLIGDAIFGVMDYFQRIDDFYPKRDLSRPSAQVRQIFAMIKKGWGKDLVNILNKKPLPVITSFFATAFFLEEHGYKEKIYCLCTDTDISRAWVGLKPKTSKIMYLAPTRRVAQRLQLYGVKKTNIIFTGFPLPKENIGGVSEKVLKKRLGCRIGNLDPNKNYQKKYDATLKSYLGSRYCNIKQKRALTITFAVGGAGAQKEIGEAILKSLHKKIDKKEIILNLVAGTKKEVYDYYDNVVKKLHLSKHHGGSINILFNQDKTKYFELFNKTLLDTDILWTKPSELSFYAGLGMPIIMAPTIGAQEVFNQTWLHSIGAGMEQQDPRFTHEWLFDWLQTGWLAQAAVEGYLDAPRMGTYTIEDIVLHGKRKEIQNSQII